MYRAPHHAASIERTARAQAIGTDEQKAKHGHRYGLNEQQYKMIEGRKKLQETERTAFR